MAGRPGPVTVEQIDQWLAVMLRAVRANEVVVSFALRDDAEFEKLGVKRIGTNGKPFDLKRASAEYRNLGICKPLMVDGKVYRPKVPRESIRKMLPKDLVG